MESVAHDVAGVHLLVADRDTLRVIARIRHTSDGQAGPGRGGRNQFDQRWTTTARPPDRAGIFLVKTPGCATSPDSTDFGRRLRPRRAI